MRADAILDAVKARLVAAGLSTRPWILLGRDGAALAFDDTDTLVTGGEPWPCEAVERLIRDELRALGLYGAETDRVPDTGEVRIRYQRRPAPSPVP